MKSNVKAQTNQNIKIKGSLASANGLFCTNQRKGGDYRMFTVEKGVFYIDLLKDGEKMTIWETLVLCMKIVPFVILFWLFLVMMIVTLG